MLRIGIISDSHQRIDAAKSAIEYLKTKKVDLLLHAGDIVKFETLKNMKNSGIKYCAVLGNNDSSLVKYKSKFQLFDEPYSFEFKKFKIKMMHYPLYLSNSVNLVVYGHTHYFATVLNNGTLYLNPGEICGRKKPLLEFAYLTYDDGKFRVFKVESKPNKIAWNEREIPLEAS